MKLHAIFAIVSAALSGAGFALHAPLFGVIWAMLAVLQALSFGIASAGSG